MSARLVFHPKYGEIWKASCPACTWTSTRRAPLPCKTEAEALHVLKLHRVLCKGAARKP